MTATCLQASSSDEPQTAGAVFYRMFFRIVSANPSQRRKHIDTAVDTSDAIIELLIYKETRTGPNGRPVHIIDASSGSRLSCVSWFRSSGLSFKEITEKFMVHVIHPQLVLRPSNVVTHQSLSQHVVIVMYVLCVANPMLMLASMNKNHTGTAQAM